VLSVSVPGGSPTPLNFDVPADSNNEVYGNVFIARKETPKEHATALYCVYGDGTGTRVHDNVFFSNDRMFECTWDAPQNYTFTNNRFYRLSPEDKIVTYYFWNAKPVSGFRFIDCTFGPGTSPQGWQFPDTKEDWPRDAEFTLGWTVTLKVTAEGKPVPGAKVTAVPRNAAAGDAKTWTTDADGKVTLPVNQFTVLFHGQDRTTVVAENMPLAVTVDGGDAGAYACELTIEKTCDVDVDLKAKKHTVTPRKDEPAPDLAKILDEAMKKTGPQAGR